MRENGKRLMVMGAGYTQIPLIQAAKRLGCRVAAVSIEGDYPGFDEADERLIADLSDPDAVVRAALGWKPDGVATCGLDLCMRSIGAVSEQLGLCGPGRQAAMRASDKLLMKEAFTRAGVQTAPWICVRNRRELEKALDKLRFPVIVKAVDLMGSRGIFRSDTREEALENYEKTMAATGKDYCLVEEFIEGTLFGIEGMVYSGEILFLLPNNTEAFPGATPTPIGHSVPFACEETLGAQAREQAEKAIRALGLDNCPVNCDAIYKDGKVYIVEVTGRSGATGLSEMVGCWFGIDYYETIVRLALGEDVRKDFQGTRHVPCLSHTLISSRSGRLVRLENRNLPDADILEISFNVQPPDEIRAYTNGRDRIGQVMLKGESLSGLHRRLAEVLSGIYLELEGDLSLPETPVTLSQIRPSGCRLYYKREDLLPFSFGGNKVRFARQYLEDMERRQDTGMLIYGTYHSNLCRILSAACRQKQIPCAMIHNVDDADPQVVSFNSMLIGRMGVEEFRCRKGEIAPCVAAARASMEKKGLRPYYIYGDDRGQGNAHTAMEAYVQVYREIRRQERRLNLHFDLIFLASSTNTTQAGLLAGQILCGDQRQIVGISVSRNAARGRQVIEEDLREYFRQRREALPQEVWDTLQEKILFFDDWLAGGYGHADGRIREAIRRVYEQDGICLDPTYTGKAFAGMEAYLAREGISDKNVLFLHTGGMPLFFDAMPEIFGGGSGEEGCNV